MTVCLIPGNKGCQLVFSGSLTYEFSRDMEDQIIGALRGYEHIDVDLSDVQEIDLCGIHLLGVLQTLGGEHVDIVADSPVVQNASQRLLASQRSIALRGRKESGLSAHA